MAWRQCGFGWMGFRRRWRNFLTAKALYLRLMSIEANKQQRTQEELGSVLERARAVAIDYYRLTGRPLGITGELGEIEAARLLGLTLAPPREAGFDAIDAAGHRYQVKAR